MADRSGVWCGILLLGIGGCSTELAKPAPPVSPPSITATVADMTPGVVEITGVKAERRADDIVSFEVTYKFTSGAPVKNYMLNLTFPDTAIAGQKPMDAWEVKPEGIIKTGLPVSDPAAKSYEITFAEADSPDRGYTVISNTYKGDLEPAATLVAP